MCSFSPDINNSIFFFSLGPIRSQIPFFLTRNHSSVLFIIEKNKPFKWTISLDLSLGSRCKCWATGKTHINSIGLLHWSRAAVTCEGFFILTWPAIRPTSRLRGKKEKEKSASCTSYLTNKKPELNTFNPCHTSTVHLSRRFDWENTTILTIYRQIHNWIYHTDDWYQPSDSSSMADTLTLYIPTPRF